MAIIDAILDGQVLTELMNPLCFGQLYERAVNFTVMMDENHNHWLIGTRDDDKVRRRLSPRLWVSLASADPLIRTQSVQEMRDLAQEIIVELSQVWHLFPREPLLAYYLGDMLDFWDIQPPDPARRWLRFTR